MKINNRAPIKYHLNLHLSEKHLNPESIAFELTRYTISQSKSDDVDLSDLKFTSKTLKYIFGDRLEGEFKELVVASIKKYIKEGYIEPKGKSMYITKKLVNQFYGI
jgi:hypothetical protein